MRIVSIHEAKVHLSSLIDGAVRGEPFIIAKSGKPLVKVTRIDAPRASRRLGFLSGEFVIPADFDRWSCEEFDSDRD